MCGIYGITDHNPTLIQNYIRTCSHRGPDGEKVWWDPEHKLTLGHNLLSIKVSFEKVPQMTIKKSRKI